MPQLLIARNVAGIQGSELVAGSSLGEADRSCRTCFPAQGPITVFIHHNTLHAFEELPFHEAVKKAAHVFGCHPTCPRRRYRHERSRGRIRFSDLREVLERDLRERRPRSRSPASGRSWICTWRCSSTRFRTESDRGTRLVRRRGERPPTHPGRRPPRRLRGRSDRGDQALGGARSPDRQRFRVAQRAASVDAPQCRFRPASRNSSTDSGNRRSRPGRTMIGKALPCKPSGGSASDGVTQLAAVYSAVPFPPVRHRDLSAGGLRRGC